MSRATKIITREDLQHTVTIIVRDLPNGDVECIATPSMQQIAERATKGYIPTMAEAYAMRILRAAMELSQEIHLNKGRPILFGEPKKPRGH